MISRVKCPHCGKEFHITRDDYKDNPEEKYCYCMSCAKEFPVLEGKPWPALEGGTGQARQPAMK